MFTTLAAVISLVGACAEQPKWVSELVRSGEARQKQERTAGVSLAASATLDGRIGLEDPAVSERYRAAAVARRKVARLIQQEKLAEAYDFVADLWVEKPELRSLMRSTLVKCALLTGRIDLAYNEVLASAHPSEVDWLYLSLAASSKGEVYEGQRDYCERLLLKFYDTQHGEAEPPKVKFDNTPASVKLLSMLALGMHNNNESMLFLEAVLKMDPKNELAATEAVQRWESMRQFSRARRIAEAMLKVLPQGASQVFFTEALVRMEGLPDEPLKLIDP